MNQGSDPPSALRPSPKPLEQAELVFNIVFTPATFRWLQLFMRSLIEHSSVRFRPIANGCPPDEIAEMIRFRDQHPTRVEEVFQLSVERMVTHGRALDEAYRELPDGDWFCFADSDIKARGAWVEDFLIRLPECAALTSGALSWTTDHVAPPGSTSLVGPYLFDDDGFVYGSSYLAMYRRSAVDSVRQRWDVGFENYGHAELPAPTRRRVEEFGRAFAVYDTAKVFNILLQADGSEVRHFENPQIAHIGGMSTEFLCQAAGVRRDDIWLAWVRSLQGPGEAAAAPEDLRVSDNPRDRQDVAEFPAVTLQCLLRGEPLPPLPPSLATETEARLRAVVAELIDLVGQYA